MFVSYGYGTRLTSPLPNIFTGVDMKSIIETELPSSSELLTSGAEDSLVMSGVMKFVPVAELETNVLSTHIKLADLKNTSEYRTEVVLTSNELEQTINKIDVLTSHYLNSSITSKDDHYIYALKFVREDILEALKRGLYYDGKVLTRKKLKMLKKHNPTLSRKIRLN